MKLLLARHGNTFEKGETPRIVGRGEDMPLTAEGEAQAIRLAELLRRENLTPSAIRCGGLQRTRRSADLIAEAFSLPAPETDQRLTELDYGVWAGLTTDDVRQEFGDAEVDAWDRKGLMPEGRGWEPATRELLANVEGFATDMKENGPDSIVLAVTSNGVLRFFSRLVPGLFEELALKNELKVGTGNLCCLEHDGAAWRLAFWNRKP